MMVCFAGDNSSASELIQPILRRLRGALDDPNTHLIGIYVENERIEDALVDKAGKTTQIGGQFGMVLTATVTKKPKVKEIQDKLAGQLRYTLTGRFKDERATELSCRIKQEQTILIILRGLYKKRDLGKIGVPYGVDHKGCKILLTSTTKGVFGNSLGEQSQILS